LIAALKQGCDRCRAFGQHPGVKEIKIAGDLVSGVRTRRALPAKLEPQVRCPRYSRRAAMQRTPRQIALFECRRDGPRLTQMSRVAVGLRLSVGAGGIAKRDQPLEIGPDGLLRRTFDLPIR
jgi:hypothetical protein